VIAHLFGLSQGQANFWIHQLSSILKEALGRKECLPARLPEEMLKKLEEEILQDLGIEGTERRIHRPKDNECQKKYYSGKKAHTVKNTLIAGLKDRQVKYLTKTHEGKKHDKKICDEEGIRCPVGSTLYRDSGFQGHEIEGVDIRQPEKNPRGQELSEAAKEHNPLMASVRGVVEHVMSGVKRCRIIKDIFRNTKEGYDDRGVELACGLHNFRSYCRLSCY
jgi:hypothetical protein